MKKNFKNKKAFTLVELMVSVVIVGILATIGMVSYKAYVKRVKLAEAVSILDVMAKNEVSYFITDKKFISFYSPVVDNGTNHITAGWRTNVPILPNNGTSYTVDSSAGDATNRTLWANLGKPITDGAKVSFIYAGAAGKNNSAGQQSLAIATAGYSNPIVYYVGSGGTTQAGVSAYFDPVTSDHCEDLSFADGTPNPNYTEQKTNAYLGIPDKNWVILVAAANLDDSTNDKGPFGHWYCSFVFKYLETNSSGKIAAGGSLFMLNFGH